VEGLVDGHVRHQCADEAGKHQVSEPSSVFRDFMAVRMAMASSVSGTLCSQPAFMQLAGITQPLAVSSVRRQHLPMHSESQRLKAGGQATDQPYRNVGNMNLYRIDLVSLSLFTLIARSGSISKGAELARLAVGAASRRIADLETAVGSDLFERHSRGITLTPAGHAMERHAQRILNDINLLAADLSDYANGVIGVVRLWASTSAITQFLPAEIAAFAATSPEIRIELEEETSDQVIMAVVDGRADFGIFVDGIPTLGLQTTHYRRDRLVLVVPAGHPLTKRKNVSFSDALDFDFVGLSRKSSLADRLDQATVATGKRLKLQIQARSFDAMCLMVAAGLGVAVLPEAAVRPHIHSMGLNRISLAEPWADRELLIGARDLGALPKPARLLAEHLCGKASMPSRSSA